MKCRLCKREAKERETFWSLSWEKVNLTEFKEREEDGRTTKISEVCPDCVTKHNDGKPPLGLKDVQNMRERGITEKQYYEEHGY
jgi:hypothetical protein